MSNPNTLYSVDNGGMPDGAHPHGDHTTVAELKHCDEAVNAGRELRVPKKQQHKPPEHLPDISQGNWSFKL
jgi:hypothetical protein